MTKLTLKEVKKRVRAKNFIFLDKTYIDSGTHMTLKCKKRKHIFRLTMVALNIGRGCSFCKGIEATIRQKTPYKVLVERAIKSGLLLVTTKNQYEKSFPNKNKYVKVACKCGKHFDIQPVNLRKTNGCKGCANKLTGDRCRTPMKKVKRYFRKYNYTLISNKYINESSKLISLCPKKHIYEVTFSDFKKSNSRCTICSRTGSSLIEQHILKAAQEIFPEIKKKRWCNICIPSKLFIKRFELDIFNKDTMRGLEFDGSYWHSFDTMRNSNGKRNWSDEDLRNYDILKDSFFLNYLGIEVLHIKQEDWNRNKQTCIQLAIAWLGGSCSIYPKPLILPI
jgi:hypothetical protein